MFVNDISTLDPTIRRDEHGVYRCFASLSRPPITFQEGGRTFQETGMKSRDEILADLKAAGVDPAALALLESLDDDAFSVMVNALLAMQQAEPLPPEPPETPAIEGTDATEGNMDFVRSVNKVAKFAESNADALRLAGRTPTDFVRGFVAAHKKLGVSAEQYGVTDAPAPAAVEKYSEVNELAKVSRFAETNVALLAKAGKTVHRFVADFKAARDKRGTLTAAEYGVPA